MMIVFMLIGIAAMPQQSFFAVPVRGFTNWQPASGWEHASLSGNGTLGAMVMGEPHDETIILSHALLYLPRKRSASLIDQASVLDSIRKLLLQGKFQEAAKIPVALRQQQGYHDERDPFIPAFDLKIQHEGSNIVRYQRSVNFKTGEAIVDWQNKAGSFQRKLFVSRADSVIALSIKGTARINCSFRFERRLVEWNQWGFINEHIRSVQAGAEGNEWLHYQSGFTFRHANAIHGYEGLGRLIALNGTVTRKGNTLQVQNADEVLLLIKIVPLYNDASQMAVLKQRLSATEASYHALLTRHIAIHGELFNRVTFSLHASEEDRLLHSVELLLRSRQKAVPAMIEKAFDAGRYNIISATGTNPPNLQGIWSGTWTAPWTGGMTNDGNLATAISMNLPGNMPELMKAFCNYHQRLLNDYRTAAKKLYNCRGIHIPAQATTTGIDTDFGEIWCLTFWTGGAGWTADFFWDYYQYTLDKEFLQQQAYPFMKEAALFYEDFLRLDNNGKYIFNPSYSPENNPANSNSQASINATMDIMIAKQLLRNCIQAAEILKTDEAKVKQWQVMLAKMPAYELNEAGALKEWIWKGLEENHRHRHASHLYALFNEIAPEFKADARLRAGAIKVIEEKMKFRAAEGGGEMAFGLVQLGSAAAHLGQSEKALQLVEWLAARYWTHGLGSYHNVYGLFNTDISGGLPYLITQMLVYSEQGLVSVLPALPAEWTQGSIKGLLLRGNIILEKLQWNGDEVEIVLRANHPQKITLQFPFAVESGKRDTVTKMELELPRHRSFGIIAKRAKK
ncbi:MAG TPA: glycoside hydrolase N-terminal domain-containing protein [Chitinophagaceae bacterium]|nr:glycoside hydrolase N-terminal domain-containing protein [Chitinophagaceae bacterium]